MTFDLPTIALVLLAWLGLSILAVLGWYLALAPRRAARRYRRWQQCPPT
jgi:hypothetical protein